MLVVILVVVGIRRMQELELVEIGLPLEAVHQEQNWRQLQSRKLAQHILSSSSFLLHALDAQLGVEVTLYQSLAALDSVGRMALEEGSPGPDSCLAELPCLLPL